MPRDESRDIAIEHDWLKLAFESSVYPTMVPVIPPAPGAQCGTYVRYIPFSQYEKLAALADELCDVASADDPDDIRTLTRLKAGIRELL